MKQVIKRQIIVCLIIAGFILVCFPVGHSLNQQYTEKKQSFENNEDGSQPWVPSFRWQKREATVTFTECIENKNNQTISVTVFIPTPRSRFSQQIQTPITFKPYPFEMKKDRWGQEVACYNKLIPPNENRSFSMTINATLYTIRYLLLPCLISNEIPKEIKTHYIVDDSKYKIYDSFIQNIVKDIVKETDNMLVTSIKLHNYLLTHLEYAFDGRGNWDDAVTVLKRGNGSCSEYCYAYIALLRAAGIPARYIGGSIFTENVTSSSDKMFHRIVEIYLPNYGWIPVDPTWNDYGKIPYFYFGSYENNFLVLSQGGGSSEYLDWQYTHFENWKPPVNNVDVTVSFEWKSV